MYNVKKIVMNILTEGIVDYCTTIQLLMRGVKGSLAEERKERKSESIDGNSPS
jgi:hypothetical protein